MGWFSAFFYKDKINQKTVNYRQMNLPYFWLNYTFYLFAIFFYSDCIYMFHLCSSTMETIFNTNIIIMIIIFISYMKTNYFWKNISFDIRCNKKLNYKITHSQERHIKNHCERFSKHLTLFIITIKPVFHKNVFVLSVFRSMWFHFYPFKFN